MVIFAKNYDETRKFLFPFRIVGTLGGKYRAVENCL